MSEQEENMRKAWKEHRENIPVTVLENPLLEMLLRQAFERGWWASRGVPF